MEANDLVRVIVCWIVNQQVRVQIPTRAKIWLKISAPSEPLANLAMIHSHSFIEIIAMTKRIYVI